MLYNSYIELRNGASVMRFCAYRQWKGVKLREVVEYFSTADQAAAFIKKQRKSEQYEWHVGEYVFQKD
jgi:hypothetical protein